MVDLSNLNADQLRDYKIGYLIGTGAGAREGLGNAPQRDSSPFLKQGFQDARKKRRFARETILNFEKQIRAEEERTGTTAEITTTSEGTSVNFVDGSKLFTPANPSDLGSNQQFTLAPNQSIPSPTLVGRAEQSGRSIVEQQKVEHTIREVTASKPEEKALTQKEYEKEFNDLMSKSSGGQTLRSGESEFFLKPEQEFTGNVIDVRRKRTPTEYIKQETNKAYLKFKNENLAPIITPIGTKFKAFEEKEIIQRFGLRGIARDITRAGNTPSYQVPKIDLGQVLVNNIQKQTTLPPPTIREITFNPPTIDTKRLAMKGTGALATDFANAPVIESAKYYGGYKLFQLAGLGLKGTQFGIRKLALGLEARGLPKTAGTLRKGTKLFGIGTGATLTVATLTGIGVTALTSPTPVEDLARTTRDLSIAGFGISKGIKLGTKRFDITKTVGQPSALSTVRATQLEKDLKLDVVTQISLENRKVYEFSEINIKDSPIPNVKQFNERTLGLKVNKKKGVTEFETYFGRGIVGEAGASRIKIKTPSLKDLGVRDSFNTPSGKAFDLELAGRLQFNPSVPKKYMDTALGTFRQPNLKGKAKGLKDRIDILDSLRGVEREIVVRHELIHAKTPKFILNSPLEKLPYRLRPSEILAFGLEKSSLFGRSLPKFKSLGLGKLDITTSKVGKGILSQSQSKQMAKTFKQKVGINYYTTGKMPTQEGIITSKGAGVPFNLGKERIIIGSSKAGKPIRDDINLPKFKFDESNNLILTNNPNPSKLRLEKPDIFIRLKFGEFPEGSGRLLKDLRPPKIPKLIPKGKKAQLLLPSPKTVPDKVFDISPKPYRDYATAEKGALGSVVGSLNRQGGKLRELVLKDVLKDFNKPTRLLTGSTIKTYQSPNIISIPKSKLSVGSVSKSKNKLFLSTPSIQLPKIKTRTAIAVKQTQKTQQRIKQKAKLKLKQFTPITIPIPRLRPIKTPKPPLFPSIKLKRPPRRQKKREFDIGKTVGFGETFSQRQLLLKLPKNLLKADLKQRGVRGDKRVRIK